MLLLRRLRIYALLLLLFPGIRGLAQPVAAFSTNPDTADIISNCIWFWDESTGNIAQWEWHFGTDVESYTTPHPGLQHCFPSTRCYTVTLIVTDNLGLRDTTAESICINPDYQLYIPNCFLPNGDGINDVFLPAGSYCAANVEMRIYSRWGTLVYFEESQSGFEGWDGRSAGGNQYAPEGPYLYEITLTECNGTRHDYRNTVLLLH